MIVGAGNDIQTKLKDLFAQQQQPQQQQSFEPPVGIYGPTSIIGKEMAARYPDTYQPQDQSTFPAPAPYYGPTSQMAREMGTTDTAWEPGPSDTSGFSPASQMQQRFGQPQSIEYYKNALANMIQRMLGGGQ